MLVLSRKEGERLVIGDNITITINRISGNRIAIGVEAPREMRIVRGELTAFEEDSSTADASDDTSKRLAVGNTQYSSTSIGTFDLNLNACGNVAVLESAKQ